MKNERRFRDNLTGLSTITHFFETVEEGRLALEEEGGRAAILFMDLSGMKFYNMNYGFEEGNRLIASFAEVISRYFGRDNCARYGADHFVAIAGVEGLDEKLEDLFRDCRGLNKGRSLPIRVGIYVDRLGPADISTACDRAKLACDRLRNVYVSGAKYFDDEMEQDMEIRRYVIENLNRAIEEKWITVYYHPIVRAINGRVCDEEALARWIDPERGMLSPGDFIPALEESHLVYRLDLHMLDCVLEKLLAQAAAGLEIVPQSINISRADFEVCDMVEEIRRRVDDSGLGRKYITIEITESIIGSDFEFMKEQVERFTALGFPVWMDDFGSGYSSLDVLQSINFDLIKFDMRFMQKFDQGDRGKIILTELMRMATALDIDTLCEGVETEEQVRFLQEIGCSKLQGYYYAKPMPLEDIFERYRTGRQIGFENPKESEYFETIGRVNLYDLAMLSQDDENSFRNFFNTIPVAILEVDGDKVNLVRSNQSYRDFMQRRFGLELTEENRDYGSSRDSRSVPFTNAVRQCCRYGSQSFFDEQMPDGDTVTSYIRRIAVNPETGTNAVAVAVLNIMNPDQGTTYATIARALAAEYFNLFYVDIDTEDFIEYSSDADNGGMVVERHGSGFFVQSRENTRILLHEDDQEGFIEAFNMQNVLKTIDSKGAFVHRYRLRRDSGSTEHVSMKAARMPDGRHLIIGVRAQLGSEQAE